MEGDYPDVLERSTNLVKEITVAQIEPVDVADIAEDPIIYPLSVIKRDPSFVSQERTTTLQPQHVETSIVDPSLVDPGVVDTGLVDPAMILPWIKKEPGLSDSFDKTNPAIPEQNEETNNLFMVSEQGDGLIAALSGNPSRSEFQHDRIKEEPSSSIDTSALLRNVSKATNGTSGYTANLIFPVALFNNEITSCASVGAMGTEQVDGGDLQRVMGDRGSDGSVDGNLKRRPMKKMKPNIRNHPHKCIFCEYTSYLLADMVRHATAHAARDKPYTCKQCGYRSEQRSNLVDHVCSQTETQQQGQVYPQGDCRPEQSVTFEHLTSRHVRVEHQDLKRRHPKRIKTNIHVQPHKCTFCDVTSSSLADMLRHAAAHAGSKPYTCSKCEYRTDERSNLTDHVCSLTGTHQQQHVCSQSECRADQSAEFDEHLKTHSRVKPYTCSKCYYRTDNSSNLDEHFGTHTNGQISILDEHLRRHTGNKTQELRKDVERSKPHKCMFCDCQCSSLADMTRHATTHEEEKPYKHYQSDLKSIKTTIKFQSREKPFVCSQCDFASAGLLGLKTHMRIHTGSSYKCIYCKFGSDDKEEFIVHWETHVGEEKPYVCSVCDERFTRKGELNAHMTAEHRVEKPYTCSMCEYKSANIGGLEAHLKIHGEEKPFKCTQCHRSYVEKRSLVVHMRLHTGEEPYSCHMCAYKTRNNSCLQKHIMRHPGQNPCKWE